MMSIDKGVNGTHHHDSMLEASQKHSGDRSSNVLPIRFVAEQGCGSLLFLVLWRVIKFAIAVQTKKLNPSAVPRAKEQEIPFHSWS